MLHGFRCQFCFTIAVQMFSLTGCPPLMSNVLATVKDQGSPGLGLRVPGSPALGSPPFEKHQKPEFQARSLGAGLKVPGTGHWYSLSPLHVVDCWGLARLLTIKLQASLHLAGPENRLHASGPAYMDPEACMPAGLCRPLNAKQLLACGHSGTSRCSEEYDDQSPYLYTRPNSQTHS